MKSNRGKLPDNVSPSTPLRLSVAAAIAFPDGSMSASGLRRENARGRLVIERIAGKDYTSLADIERMRELCRVGSNLQGSISEPREGAKKASFVRKQLGHPRWRQAHRHRMR
jgi:hypothetical protein